MPRDAPLTATLGRHQGAGGAPDPQPATLRNPLLPPKRRHPQPLSNIETCHHLARNALLGMMVTFFAGIGGCSALREIYLSQCSALQSLPESECALVFILLGRSESFYFLFLLSEGFGMLASLQKLNMQNCWELTSLPDGELLFLNHFCVF